MYVFPRCMGIYIYVCVRQCVRPPVRALYFSYFILVVFLLLFFSKSPVISYSSFVCLTFSNKCLLTTRSKSPSGITNRQTDGEGGGQKGSKSERKKERRERGCDSQLRERDREDKDDYSEEKEDRMQESLLDPPGQCPRGAQLYMKWSEDHEMTLDTLGQLTGVSLSSLCD